PVWALGKFFWTPGSMNKMKKERLVATVGLIAAAVLFVFVVPLPFSVKCTFEIQPTGGHQVFPVVSGQNEVTYVRPGQHVDEGQKLFDLVNVDLKLQVMELEGKYRQAEEAYNVLF